MRYLECESLKASNFRTSELRALNIVHGEACDSSFKVVAPS